MANRSSEIVIGIDFGTTFSGVAWAVNGGARHIRVINSWPNSGGSTRTQDKTPSVISARNRGNEIDPKWGYEVGFNDKAFHWIKILLESGHTFAKSVSYVKESSALLEETGKSAVEVVAEYLKLLWNFTMEDIEKVKGPNFREIYSFKVVMSVPAMWSPAAKERTLQAAKSAGFETDVRLVTEPEAAALATLKDKAEMEELKEKDCFVVCDAGGGTVDLISYEIESVNPLTIKECAIGKGDLCGSVFVDDDFQKWMRAKVGETQWNGLSPRNKQRMMKEFNTLKCNFNVRSHNDQVVELRGVEDDVSNGIQDENITVKATVMRTVFDKVCLKIVQLVEAQISEVQSKCSRKPKAVLLVGGFGQSDYLHSQLKEAFQSQRIMVIQATGALSAICRGAALWGLEHSERRPSTLPPTVSSRLARYSYGISVSEPFDSSKHSYLDKVWNDAKGTWYAKDQMEWLIKKGEEFEEGQILHCGVYEILAGITWRSSGTRRFSENLLYCEDDIPPTRGIKTLCTVSWVISESDLWAKTMSYKKSKVKYRDAQFIVAAILGNANLDFAVAYEEEIVAACEANYPDA